MPGEYLPPVVTRLTGDIDDLIQKVEEAKAAIKGLGGTNITVGFEIDKASLARAQAAAKAAFGTGVTVPVRFDTNAAGAFARGAGFGAFGWLVGLAGRSVNLFGGVLPGILGSIGALHLAIDLFAELAAVVIPASVALAAFGIAASDAVNNIVRQFTAIHTVMDATGQAIPPMTNAMENLHRAVQPQVYGMLGDALTIINAKASTFTMLAKGASDVLSQLAARATVAITSSGLSAFMKNAVGDLAGLGNGIANIFGTIGAILKNLPGYAQVFLNVFQGITHAVEVFANSGVGQGIIRFGLAFHGALIYIGLLGTLVARVIPMVIGWITRLALSTAVLAEGAGFSKLSEGLLSFAGAGEEAAALPWGWIALVAAGIGVLAYKVMTAKDATQQWTAVMQQTLLSKSAGLAGFNQLAGDSVQTAGKLAAAQITLKQQTVGTAAATTNLTASIHTGTQGISAAAQRVNDLTSRQAQLSDETNLYNFRLDALAQKYGGVTNAQRLLTLAGVKMSDMLDKSGQKWKIIQQQVAGVVTGYAAMATRSGTIGADLFILTQQASDQYTAMQKLNQAWQTFIGTTASLQTGAEQVITAMRTMTGEANKAHASFTGVNSQSIALQSTFEQQLYPQLQNVIGGMRQGGSSAQDMAQVISTMLSPAVHHGALENQGLRTQIYDMAREAGYAGPNKIGPLTGFIDRNRGSLYSAMQAVDRYTAALGHIPNPENLKIYVHGVGQWQAPRGMAARPGFNAAGGLVRGGIPGRDSVLSWLMPGEVVVPTHMVHAGAVDHLRGKLPRFASGGVVPSYSGNVAGLTPWTQNNYSAMENAFSNALSKTFPSFLNSMGGGPGGGRTSAGGQYNRSMLANLWQQAGGPGGYIALIAAAIALAESGGNPLARNPSGASGLWQILGQVVPGNIFNPFTNALNAVSKFDSAHGFSPWVTYTTGAYRAFMDGGGYLQPGLNIITNNTGQPERVLAPGEHETIELHVYLDGKEISSNVQMRARRYNRRNGPRGTDKWAKPA